MSKGMASEREKKHAGSRPGRGGKEELYPGMGTADFMESRVGVISSSGHSGEEVGGGTAGTWEGPQRQLSLPSYPWQDLASYFLVLPSIPGSGLST